MGYTAFSLVNKNNIFSRKRRILISQGKIAPCDWSMRNRTFSLVNKKLHLLKGQLAIETSHWSKGNRAFLLANEK